MFLRGEIYRKSVFLQNWSMIELNEYDVIVYCFANENHRVIWNLN